MNTSRHDSSGRFITISLILLVVVAFGLALLGCGTSDVITYSRDAQRKGIAHYNDGSYGEAAGAFRNAARQNPRDYRSYYYLGASYEQMGQSQQAISNYRTALNTLNISLAAKEDEEFRMRIINGLGRAIARSDQRDIETNAMVNVAQNKGGADNWFIVAKVYAFRGDPDSAIDAYNRAALLAPQNFLLLKDYGLYLDSIGQIEKAQIPLRRAYALRNDDENINLALRRAGVVPGPSLKARSALAQPVVPKGPIPELELKLDFLRGRDRGASAQPPPPQMQQTSVEAPRD